MQILKGAVLLYWERGQAPLKVHKRERKISAKFQKINERNYRGELSQIFFFLHFFEVKMVEIVRDLVEFWIFFFEISSIRNFSGQSLS